MAHVRKQAEAPGADPSATLYANLELSALLWWADEKDEAVRALEKAAGLAPGDVELRLTLAELWAQRREPEEALAIVDSVESVDQDVTRRREILALQTGRVERARRAADRLFGLRLESAVQVQLAAQMDQLGMHAMSESVLARARRWVGNNPDALVSLMTQYERQQRTDAAVQIAYQILRRGTNLQYVPRGLDDPWQRQAMQVLVRSGKLDEIIERLEVQLRQSPQSLQIQQSLATYYRAAGKTSKLRDLTEEMARLRPDDNRLRIQLALQLVQSGDTPTALDHLRAVLRKEPYQYDYHYTEIRNAFQQKNKLDDLAALYDQVDLRSLGSPHFSLVQTLLNEPRTFDRGMRLWAGFRDAFPNDLLNSMSLFCSIEEFWKQPGTYDNARKAVIPGAAATRVDSWSGLDTAAAGGLTAGGRQLSVTSRLLGAATARGTLEELGAEVALACDRFPRWHAGKALLGAIRIRQGGLDEGRHLLRALLDDPSAKPTVLALEFIGQEVFDIPEALPLATAVFEREFKAEYPFGRSLMGFRNSAARQLTTLYGLAGRLTEARRIVLQAAAHYRANRISADSTPGLAVQKIFSFNAIGDMLLSVGAPADALRVFAELQDMTEEFKVARNSPYGDQNSLLGEAREKAERASHALDRETIGPTLRALIAPTPLPDDKDRSAPFDLSLVVYPREVDRAAVTSLYPRALELADDDPGLLAEVRQAVEARLKDHPGDLAARTTATLLACAGSDPKAIAEAAEALERQVSEAPLEAISEGGRPNVRQRAEAAPRLALWLVARACWRHEASREAGDRLAAIALEAARRQDDNAWTLAMLRELGQQSWDRGDRAAAEARWTSMLELVQSGAASAKATAPAPALSRARPGAATARGGTLAVTPERFGQAADIARLAADRGLFALSSRAVVGPLGAGRRSSP